MKPIFYKTKLKGEYYKVQFNDDIPEWMIDACLDVLSPENVQFCTEDEFMKAYEKLMVIDIKDSTSSIKIGELTTKWLDMTNVDVGTTL